MECENVSLESYFSPPFPRFYLYPPGLFHRYRIPEKQVLRPVAHDQTLAVCRDAPPLSRLRSAQHYTRTKDSNALGYLIIVSFRFKGAFTTFVRTLMTLLTYTRQVTRRCEYLVTVSSIHRHQQENKHRHRGGEESQSSPLFIRQP